MKILIHPKSRSRVRGFTLVEIMVVIGIIGILSAIVYANFSDSRKITRDNIRKTDLKNLQIAIELYKAQNGVYPDACTPGSGAWSGSVKGDAGCRTRSSDFITGLVPDYIADLPIDPMYNSYSDTSNAGYLYRVSTDKLEYKLMANSSVEKMLVTSYSDDFARCARNMNTLWCGGDPPTNTYAVYKGSTAAGW